MIFGSFSRGKKFVGYTKPTTWFNDSKAAVSLTFDDGNQVSHVLPILGKYRVKATFNIVPSFVGTQGYDGWNTLRMAFKEGHEIASHGLSHQSLLLKSGATKERILYELKESKRLLEEKIGPPCISFAYPGGHYNSFTIKLVKRVGYLSARASAHLFDTGYNDAYTPRFYSLKVKAILRKISAENANKWVSKAVKTNKWLIEMYHTMICGHDKYVWDKPTFEKHLSSLEQQDVWVATQGEIVKYILERNNFKVLKLQAKNKKIKILIDDFLDRKIFNQWVTLKTKIPEEWSSKTVLLNWRNRVTKLKPFFEDGEFFVRYNVIPRGEVILAVK